MQPAPNPAPDSPGDEADTDVMAVLRRQAGAANINETTLLATDYLNHFNEFVMVIDLIPDMPDCLEDAEAWQPKGYQDHFRDSTFSARDLAIRAYDYSPAEYREQFESLVNLINTMIPRCLDRIRAVLDSGEAAEIAHECTGTSQKLQKLMDLMSAVINGEKPTIDQSGIDKLLDN